MKKIFAILSLSLMVMLLAGCISIPIGENALEISTNGIELVSQDKDDETTDSDTDGAELEESNNTETETDDKEAEEVTGEEQKKSDKEPANKDCEEQDHSQITDTLGDDFYIPDCAVLTAISKTDKNIDARLTVTGDWEEVFNSYKTFIGDNITTENQKPEEGSGAIEASFDEERTTIRIKQEGEEVSLRIIQYF